MTDERNCGYCDSSFRTDEALVDHLAASHDREQLSRVDRKRVETHAGGASGSRLRAVTPDGQLSRRATLVAAGTVLAGIGVGIGRRMAQTPNEISNWTELQNLNLSGDYVLANDLDENTAGYDNLVGDPPSGWDPIGDGGNRFTGTFDGQGNEIRGLEIDRPTEGNVGLFRRIGSGAQVQQLSVTNATVTGEGGAEVDRSGPGVGVLAGGTDGGTITDCLVSGAVETTGDLGGGLVGNVDSGTISRTAADVDVSGPDGGIGGFAGTVAAGSSIADSYAVGPVDGGLVVGGFIGDLYGGEGEPTLTETPSLEGSGDDNEDGTSNDDTPDTPDTPGEDMAALSTTVMRSYSAGEVTAGGGGGEPRAESYRGEAGTLVVGGGGFVGNGNGDPNAVTECYWDEDSSGKTDSDGGTGLTTSEMQGSEAVGNMTGFDFTTTWQTVDGDDAGIGIDGYPILTALDEDRQLALQGVPAELSPGVVVEGNDVTFDNVTVKRGDN